MTPSQETCPEQFPHEETAMDRHLGTVGVCPTPPGTPPVSASRARRRLLSLLAVPVLGAGLGVGAAAIMVPTASLCAAAAQTGHVALVVETGGGSTTARCVGFGGASVTAEQIIKASRVEYAVQSYGSLGDALCQVENEPASYTKCLPSSGDYWALFVSRSGGAWKSASKGIGEETLHSGDAVGLRYDPLTGADPPPSRSPAGVCAAAEHSAAVAGTAVAPTSSSGPSAGLIAGIAVAALLVVLLAVQLTLRRRRT